MDKTLSEDRRHSSLVATYMFNKSIYNLTFKERIDMDLGNTLYSIKTHSDIYDNISCDELSNMLAKLKKPWWNNLYERVKENTKVLLILNLLLNIRYYRFQVFKLLYKIIKTK